MSRLATTRPATAEAIRRRSTNVQLHLTHAHSHTHPHTRLTQSVDPLQTHAYVHTPSVLTARPAQGRCVGLLLLILRVAEGNFAKLAVDQAT
jgi:hypothetical protein